MIKMDERRDVEGRSAEPREIAVRTVRSSGMPRISFAAAGPSPTNQPIEDPTPCARAASMILSERRPSS